MYIPVISFLSADTAESIATKNSNHKNAGKWCYLIQPNGAQPIPCHDYTGDGNWSDTSLLKWFSDHNPTKYTPSGAFGILVDGMSDSQIAHVIRYFNNQAEFPLKFSFDPYAVYEDLPSSSICPYNGKDYPPEVLAVDGRICGNCAHFNATPSLISKAPMRLNGTTCEINPGYWAKHSFCSKFAVQNEIRYIPQREMTMEQKREFEEHHKPDDWEIEQYSK
jgi:hypothetical protein